MVCTHGNVVGFRAVRLVVILVHGVLAYYQSHTDQEGKLVMIVRRGSKDFVDMVHCWNDCGKVWGSTRTEEGCVFENLCNN